MTKKEELNSDFVVTTEDLATILGVSKRRVQQLATENHLHKFGRGKFDLPASIRLYTDYLIERHSGGDNSKSEEEMLWTRARRIKTETEVKIMQGSLHRSADVEAVMNDMLGNFRARMLVLPQKVASSLLHQDEIEVIKDIVKKAILEGLSELSEYDPEVFYGRSNDELFIEEHDEREQQHSKTD
ncbi:helix-turn-helix domain-containing protein [Paenalkalicoccus suaedae]|uniref:Helix-turn-helix domain-containing protein n=1 Tax=Paenalkalicoccus suaedae TaxID=2592382 RepID=A0A859FCF2_9BACI|nr:helix-turn-helix domain-containing protein [Paenalkalicoccus suaedae]QKS70244.1 helix-turn-helix domain-containing protein [Paenalkalicoccus suaedae]